MLYSGRYHKHSNEVALGGNSAKATEKTIGDTVTITQGGIEKDFYVTGIIQMMNSQGVNMVMTYDGLLTIQPDYLYDQIYIYLEDSASVPDFLDKVLENEGDIFTTRLDMKELADA